MSFNEECFVIESKALYFEKALVEYDYVPIFFLCKDNMEEFYIALCIDFDELTYVVANISESDTYSLLHGQITMREVITKKEDFWHIQSGEELSLDKVKQCPIKELKEDWLPESGAYFQVLTEDMRRYVDDFDEKYMKSSLNDKFLDLSMNVLDESRFISSGFNVQVFEEFAHRKKSCNMKTISMEFDVWYSDLNYAMAV